VSPWHVCSVSLETITTASGTPEHALEKLGARNKAKHACVERSNMYTEDNFSHL